MQETQTRSHDKELQQLIETSLDKLPFSLREFIIQKSNGSISGDVISDLMLLWLKKRDELIKTHNITEQQAKRVIYYENISIIFLLRELSQFLKENHWSTYGEFEKLIVKWIVDKG